MDIYKELNLKSIRTEPDVWVSRLVIFEQITPEPAIIRDIPLSRGLNIIWAEEVISDDSSAVITGHSAGKTTFCRLLRYCLGEKTYSTKSNMDLIQKALPGGYVAAELHIRSKKWAVLRPIGTGRNSYIKPDATIEELLKDRTRSAYLTNYAQNLGLVELLDDLGTSEIVRTGEIIQWEHILAWCTRDQEARFQSIHEWRSHRSESDTPAFRFSKADPLFVMRAVLGLFLPDELKGEESLAKLLRLKEELALQFENKKREPQYRVSLYDEQLRQRLKIKFPDEKDLDIRPFHSDNLFPEDLNRLTNKAISQNEQDIEKLNKEYIELQKQIDDIGAQIRQHENLIKSQDDLFNVNMASVKELDEGLKEREKQRSILDQYGEAVCLGGLVYRNCEFVQKRQRILQITTLQDAHAMKQAEAQRNKEIEKLNETKQRVYKAIDEKKSDRQHALLKRDALLSNLQKMQQEINDLNRLRKEFKIWEQKLNEPGGYEALDIVRKKLDKVEKDIASIEVKLSKFLREHDQNRLLLDSIFSGAVRSVLNSGSYDGKVRIEKRELAFRITNGPAMSGEAVETLSVLLADITSLIYNTVSSDAHLPSFLLHDSPREADLGIRIYLSFIRFAASLQQHFGELDVCPFQYILTTTTPPPKELQNEQFLKLKLNSAQESGLLFRKNITTTTNFNTGLFTE